MNEDFAKHLGQSVADFYEDHGAAFAATRGSLWAEMQVAASFVQPGMTVVDVGAGNGRFASLLSAHVNYIGIEPSSTLRAASPTPLQEGGFPSLPVEDAVADVTVCFAVFHHLSETLRHQAVEELLRITKPGGIIVATSWYLPVDLYRPVESGQVGDIWVPWNAEGANVDRFVHVFSQEEWQKTWSDSRLTINKIGLFGRQDWTESTDGARNWMVIAKKTASAS